MLSKLLTNKQTKQTIKWNLRPRKPISKPKSTVSRPKPPPRQPNRQVPLTKLSCKSRLKEQPLLGPRLKPRERWLRSQTPRELQPKLLRKKLRLHERERRSSR